MNYEISFPDKRFLGLGFGGIVNGRVSHCFPLNGKSREPYCQGIDGVVNAYYDSLENGTYFKLFTYRLDRQVLCSKIAPSQNSSPGLQNSPCELQKRPLFIETKGAILEFRGAILPSRGTILSGS